MTTRRALLRATLASIALASTAPRLHAQTRVRRIGFLWGNDYSHPRYVEAFKAGMQELGYIEGREYSVESRSARLALASLPALAAELVASKVDLIIASGTPTAVAARSASRDIPIISVGAGDPVGSGLAESLRRPGGNITGLTSISVALYTKRLDLLRQVLPNARRIGFVYNPNNGNDASSLREFESNCERLELKSLRAPVRTVEDIGVAFRTLQRDQAQGLIVTNTSTNLSRETVIDQAAKHRLPAVYAQSVHAEAGGLVSYGASFPDLYRRAAAYVVKIFKGAKPGELPFEQPHKFELVINLKTAKGLGITIPQSILVSADRVIE